MHPNILEILFKHKNEIFRKLSDLRGLYYIDHVSITLIDPDHEITIFSITPSVEFNLIVQGLWHFDRSFNPAHYAPGKLLFWDKAYLNGYQNDLKYIKETQHDFSLGFNLLRKVDNFNLIYSFATRKTGIDLKKYYQSMICDLYSFGDYGYRQLRDIYDQYSDKYPAPLVEVDNQIAHMRSYLKLIVNNE